MCLAGASAFLQRRYATRMNSKDMAKRLQAAQTLLLEPTTTREKFSSIRQLIHGINPQIDEHLSRIDQHLSTWDKVESGDVIHLTAENLPENTEEEKKRKKYVLLLITSWKQLQGEVARVSAEVNANGSTDASSWGRIISGAKGPVGLITVVALAVVALQQTSVGLTIKNDGCPTFQPSGVAISIPGFSLSKESIPDGGFAKMTIPPLSLHIESNSNTITMGALNYNVVFDLPSNISDVVLNGESLLGKTSDVQLSQKDEHTLVLECQ